MATPNLIEIREHLSGVDSPASWDDIVSTAEQLGADGDVLDALKGIPDGQYDAPTAVSSAVSDAS